MMVSTLNAENVQVWSLNSSGLNRNAYRLNEFHTSLKQWDMTIHRDVF